MDGQKIHGRAAYDALKRSLFADLRGTVLEIGAGKPAKARTSGCCPARSGGSAWSLPGGAVA